VAAGGRSSSVISLRSASSWPGSRGGFWEFKQDPLRSQANRRAVFAAECRARSIPVAPRSRLYCGLTSLHDVSQLKGGVSEAYTTTVGHAADTAAASGPVPVNSRFR
jgi:hypothetical protein